MTFESIRVQESFSSPNEEIAQRGYAEIIPRVTQVIASVLQAVSKETADEAVLFLNEVKEGFHAEIDKYFRKFPAVSDFLKDVVTGFIDSAIWTIMVRFTDEDDIYNVNDTHSVH